MGMGKGAARPVHRRTCGRHVVVRSVVFEVSCTFASLTIANGMLAASRHSMRA